MSGLLVISFAWGRPQLLSDLTQDVLYMSLVGKGVNKEKGLSAQAKKLFI